MYTLGQSVHLSYYLYSSDFNATILMHKSTLSPSNFGNNHFEQEYKKQNILRIFRRI